MSTRALQAKSRGARGLRALLALPLLLFFLASLLLPLVSDPRARIHAHPGAQAKVLLLSGPIHYDFLIPLDGEGMARFGWLESHGLALSHPRARWLVIGWGARDFYMTVGGYQDVSPRALIKGIFGDRAVIRVDLAGTLPAGLRTRAVPLSQAQQGAIFDAIEQSFAQGRQTVPLDHPGLSGGDLFFPAKRRFHIFETCNVWIGRMLRQAGLRFGLWTPAPYSVSLSHAWFIGR